MHSLKKNPTVNNIIDSHMILNSYVSLLIREKFSVLVDQLGYPLCVLIIIVNILEVHFDRKLFCDNCLKNKIALLHLGY